jgi:hypothetical protein
VVFIVLLSDSPRCRLGEALEDLPPGQYRFCPPGPGQGIPYPPGRTVAVLSDQMAEPPLAPPRLPAGCPIIFSGQNLAAAQFARSSGLTPLDCGLSLRDTLTLSSLTSRSAVISLQRPVARLDGALAEPGDIPLPLSREWAPFPLLCRAGVLLLSGGTAALDPNLF